MNIALGEPQLLFCCCSWRCRLLVARKADCAPDAGSTDGKRYHCPVLAVTTRAPDTDPGVLFSGERSSEVSITPIDVSIPATGKSDQCNGREVRLLIRQESSLQLQRGSSIERAQ